MRRAGGRLLAGASQPEDLSLPHKEEGHGLKDTERVGLSGDRNSDL